MDDKQVAEKLIGEAQDYIRKSLTRQIIMWATVILAGLYLCNNAIKH